MPNFTVTSGKQTRNVYASCRKDFNIPGNTWPWTQEFMEEVKRLYDSMSTANMEFALHRNQQLNFTFIDVRGMSPAAIALWLLAEFEGR